MPIREDYYRILQVDPLADPEVIEAAYKKLSKKYHPDISKDKNAEEIMKRINLAYGVLRDDKKREAYNMGRHNKKTPEDRRQARVIKEDSLSVFEAKNILDNYFNSIKERNFDTSYGLLSKKDRGNISKDDYIYWQNSVSKIFKLKDHNLRLSSSYKYLKLKDQVYEKAFEFSIDLKEYNLVMEIEENSSLSRYVIFEKGKWSLFLGYDTIQPFIDKFENLKELLTNKYIIQELDENYSKVDPLTGFLNKKGIIEKIENEALRHERYGNFFSLIRVNLSIKLYDKDLSKTRLDTMNLLVKNIGQFLSNNLREIDYIGRWDEDSFLLLLPETPDSSAFRVLKRIERSFKNNFPCSRRKEWQVKLDFSKIEYKPCLGKKESLREVRFGMK